MANRNFRGDRVRRRYQWIRESQNSTELANATVLGLLGVSDAEMLAEALAAPTLVRIRGEYLFELDPATTSASETQIVTVGIIVTKTTVTALEAGGPATNPNLEWMYWKAHQLSAPSVITSSGVNVEGGIVRVDFDVKAMRKIHKSDVHMIVENSGPSDAHAFVAASWSLLFQE